MSIFFIRIEILKEILADKEYGKKFEDAKTTEEKRKIAKEFCRKRGYKIKNVAL